MVKFTIEMRCDNAAFEDEPMIELGCILSELGDKFTNGGDGRLDGILFDRNGNRIGTWRYNPEG